MTEQNPRNQQERLTHWKLNLFMPAMICGALACFRIGVPAIHETLFAAVWTTITLGGMALWLYNNEPALRANEQARRQHVPVRIAPEDGARHHHGAS